MMGPSSPAPSRPRRFLFSLLALLLALACVELGSFLLLSLAGDDPLAEESFEEAPAASSGAPAEDVARRLRGMQARIRGQQALHPYLGYVLDADTHPTAQQEVRDPEAIEHGFPWGFGPIFHRPSEEKVVVAILGGSVASIFAGNSGPTLEANLGRIPRFAGKEVAVVNLALGGYKQPQQLMVLTYFLSLGAHFDLVLNIDGFNDIALAPRDNIEQGIFAFYPRAWRLRVEDLDPAERAATGKVSYLRQRLQELEEGAQHAPLRHSPTARLLALVSRRRLQARIETAEKDLLESASGGSYQARGPRREYASEEALLEDLARHWQSSSRLLDRLCRANGIEYYHVLQPNQYLPGTKELTDEERRRAWDEEHPYRPMIVQGYPRLIELGRELDREGVAFFDMTRVFARSDETLYMDSCCHFNRRGNLILAHAILRRIAEHPATANPRRPAPVSKTVNPSPRQRPAPEPGVAASGHRPSTRTNAEETAP